MDLISSRYARSKTPKNEALRISSRLENRILEKED